MRKFLHNNVDDFTSVLDEVSEYSGIRKDILEKDYYISLMLFELSEKQHFNNLPAYFKGGTALYKALGKLKRFSEDIDLSVNTVGVSNSKNKTLLENATKKYAFLERDVEKSVSYRSSITTSYKYNPVADNNRKDVLGRFGSVKIEATSFTKAEPTTEMMVPTLLYSAAPDNLKEIILKQKYSFSMEPFPIQIISFERIFVDKIFAVEAYSRKCSQELTEPDYTNYAREVGKHIYDLAVMMEMPNIKDFLKQDDKVAYIVNIRLEEEQNRLDGIPGVPTTEFTWIDLIKETPLIQQGYEKMLDVYVFNDEDKIPFDTVYGKMVSLNKTLCKCQGWVKPNEVSVPNTSRIMND